MTNRKAKDNGRNLLIFTNHLEATREKRGPSHQPQRESGRTGEQPNQSYQGLKSRVEHRRGKPVAVCAKEP
jgi:hypothetical protein